MTHFAMEYLERAEKLLTKAYEDIEILRRENAEVRKDAERLERALRFFEPGLNSVYALEPGDDLDGGVPWGGRHKLAE